MKVVSFTLRPLYPLWEDAVRTEQENGLATRTSLDVLNARRISCPYRELKHESLGYPARRWVWLALRSSPLSFCCPRTDLLSFLWHFVTGLSLPWTLGSRLLLVPVVNNFRISLTSFVVCSLSNVKSYKEKPFIKKQSVSNDAVQPTLTPTCRSL